MTFRPQLEALEDRLAPAVLTVNSLTDNTSDTSILNLREAITLVNSGGNPSSLGQKTMPAGWASQISGTFGSNDTIQFNPSLFSSGAQTITLDGSELPQITRNLIISGPGYNSGHVLSISGNQQSRVFSIAKAVDVAISGLSILNGLVSGSNATGGGIYNAGGTLTLANDTLYNDQAAGTPGGNALGGGIYNAATGILVLTNTTVGGRATGGNGVNGINGANGNGAGAAGGNGTAGSNGGQGMGGGIYNAGGEVSIVGSNLGWCTATGGNGGNGGNGGGGGGAGYNNTVPTSAAAGNGGPGGRGGDGGNGGAAFGGAIYNSGGTLSISNSNLSGTAYAGSGGAGGRGGNGGFGLINSHVYHANGAAGAAGGNAGAGAQALGGAIYNPTGSVRITSSSKVSGTAHGGDGGGGGNGGQGGGVVRGPVPTTATYSGNGGNGGDGGLSAVGGTGLGGGIYNGTGSITILNSTLTQGGAGASVGGNGGSGGVGAGGVVPASPEGNGGSGQNGSASGLAAGGALYNAAGPVMLQNDSISDNDVENIGGGGGGEAGAGGYVGMAGNGGAGLPASGGAIFSAGGSVSVNQTTIAGNFAETSSDATGGAGAAGTNGTDSFDGNGGAAGTAEGGAIDISGGTFALTNSFLGGNFAMGGAGVYATDPGLNGGYGGGIGGSGGDALGGAIQVSGGTLTITNTTFSTDNPGSNYATGGTGGTGGVGDNGGNGGQGGNGGTALGGNINVTAGTVILNSDTIADGQVTGGSGGSGGSSSGGTSGTVGTAGSGLGGGIQLNSGAVVKMFNTIIALSTTSSAPTSTDVAGAFTSQGHNLIGDGSDSTGFKSMFGDQIGTSANPINPMLAAPVTYPGTNGGPTDTMALLPGSPAINAGGLPKSPTVPATDQRGMTRDSHPDIGAFEYNATYDNNTGNYFPAFLAPTPQSPLSYAPTVYAKVGATFDLGSITDGVLSTPWEETVTVNWGDKSSPTTSSVSCNGGTGRQSVSLGTQSHTYAAPGVYTMTESIKNSGGIVSTEYYLVNVGSLSVKPSASTMTAGTSYGLTVSAMDAFGHPMAGYQGMVQFSSTGSATFLDAATGKTLTDNQYTFTAKDEGTHAFKVIETTAGKQTITAADTSGSGPVGTTTVTVKPGAPANLTVTSGSNQTATVNTAFALPLEATVADAYGNVISGVAVTFSAPTSGASGTFTGGVSSVAVNTNAQGVAIAPTFMANGTTGSYTVTASVMGLTAKAYFQLTNQLAS